MRFEDDILKTTCEIIIEEHEEGIFNPNQIEREKVVYEFNSPINPSQERLPVHDEMDKIMNTIENHSVIVISGNTGCGKST